jgi:hypothetical protein
MKRCPRCNADYFDNMLEYCLEDGAKLFITTAPNVATRSREQASVLGTAGPLAAPISEQTVVLNKAENVGKDEQALPRNETSQLITLVPTIVALAHNWWQWVYLEKQYVYPLTDYLLSANFVMWLLLLAGGILSGLYGLKHSKNRSYALIGLVVLAINLILFLVPRR